MSNDSRLGPDIWVDFMEKELEPDWQEDLSKLLNGSLVDRRNLRDLRRTKKALKVEMNKADREMQEVDLLDRVMGAIEAKQRFEIQQKHALQRLWRTHLSSGALVAGVVGLIVLNLINLHFDTANVIRKIQDRQAIARAAERELNLRYSGLSVNESERMLASLSVRRIATNSRNVFEESEQINILFKKEIRW